MSESELDDPVQNAGGSAEPEAAGPGSGTAPAATTLTGAAQSAANDTLGGLQGFANSAFDAGEAALTDTLKVVDAAQTGLSNLTSIVTQKITGGEGVDLPTIPTEVIGETLTSKAQADANKLLNGVQTLVNEAYDFGEEALGEALHVIDAAQKELTGLYSHVTSMLASKIGPAKG